MITIDLYSQWSNDPNVNLRITNWGDAPISAVEDGRGGAFISASWNAPLDRPPWSTRQPSLVWIDKFGYNKLDTLYSLGGYGEKYRDLKLMEDGTGNYFAVFVDRFFSPEYSSFSYSKYKDRIMIQKFDSLGHKIWGEGVYISTDTVMQHTFFETAIDEKGGCFFYFEAMDSLGSLNDNGERVVQYISQNGERVWGDKGIMLYDGPLQWNNFVNKLLYDGRNGVIIHNQNTNSLINLDSFGNTMWQITSRVDYSGRMVLLDQNKFAIIGMKYYENPYSVNLLFDKVLLSGRYEDSVITLTDSLQSGYQIESASVVNNKIFFTWKEDIPLTYLMKIDTLGNKYFGEKGIRLFDTSGFDTKVFPTDSSFVFVTDHYARNINFEGKDLWQPEILQYTTRTMTLKDFVSDGNGGFLAFWLEFLNGIWGQQVNANGQLGVVTGIIDLPSTIFPDNFTLYQNYPNPFNPTTTVSFTVNQSINTSIKVYNILGKEITTLVEETLSTGEHTVQWNGKDHKGNLLPGGVYFIQMIAGSYQKTIKTILLK